MIADIITVSRILFSVLLMFLTPSSCVFTVFYLLCGVTDVIDGFAARKLKTVSERGARLDSIADLCFVFAYAVKSLSFLNIPIWGLIWTGIIAVIKIIGICVRSEKEHRFIVEHSFLNRLTGVLIFLLPLSVRILSIKYGAIIVCLVATVSALNEIIGLRDA